MITCSTLREAKKPLTIDELAAVLPTMLEQTKEQLSEKRQQLSELKDNIAGTSEPVDIADMNLEQSKLQRDINALVDDTVRIRNSIDAITNEEYGFCSSCGCEIELRRLNAYPTSTLCIDCKTIEEIKEKQKRTH
ncbi:TraR/DksA family transcriptional regulator [Vibrio parahaemolyticus]|nr:TraR/DksA family transcriptional regulator [Vibrio parahaemolyticus]